MCVIDFQTRELFRLLMTRTRFFYPLCRKMISYCLYRRFLGVSNLGDYRESKIVTQRYEDTRAWSAVDDFVYLDVYIHCPLNLLKSSELT